MISHMQITSPMFENEQSIPTQYTCDGEDISPPLVFLEVPEETQSLALIVDDPDAPGKVWTHWVVFNIPPHIHEISEGKPPVGSIQGTNDFQRTGYGGPCPPAGVHHYYFTLYALDGLLDLPSGCDKKEVLQAIESRVIQQAELIATYKRS